MNHTREERQESLMYPFPQKLLSYDGALFSEVTFNNFYFNFACIGFMSRINVVKAGPDLSVHCGGGLLYLIILGVLHGTVRWREKMLSVGTVRGAGAGADTHSRPPPS